MFNEKYKKVIDILDKKIDFTQKMFDWSLKEANSEGKKLSDEQIFNDLTMRGGKWSYVDKYLAKLEALCELKREIQKEMRD